MYHWQPFSPRRDDRLTRHQSVLPAERRATEHPQRCQTIDIQNKFYLSLPTGTVGEKGMEGWHTHTHTHTDTHAHTHTHTHTHTSVSEGRAVDMSACCRRAGSEQNPLWWNLKVSLASSVARHHLPGCHSASCMHSACPWTKREHFPREHVRKKRKIRRHTSSRIRLLLNSDFRCSQHFSCRY